MRNSFLFSRLVWAVFSIVLFAVPLVLVAFGVGKGESRAMAERRELGYVELERVLCDLSPYEKTKDFLGKVLDIAFRSASEPHNWYLWMRNLRNTFVARFEWIWFRLIELEPEEYRALFRKADSFFREWPRDLSWEKRLKRELKNLNGRFPSTFKFYVTDRAGEIVPSLSHSSALAEPLRLLFWQLKECDSGYLFPNGRDVRARILDEVWSRVQSFIGLQASLLDISAYDRKLSLVSTGIPRRNFFAFVSPQFGWFGHADEGPDWNLLPIRDLVTSWRPPPGSGMRVGLLEPNPLPGQDKGEAMLVRRLAFQRITRFESGSRQYLLVPKEGNFFLWASRPCPPVFPPWARPALAMGIGAVFGALSWFLHGILIRRKGLALPIKWKLTLLFSYAAGFPLLAILVVGGEYLGHLSQSAETAVHQDLERILKIADVEYPRFRKDIEKRVKGCVRNHGFSSPTERKILTESLFRLGAQLPPGEFVITDGNGKTIWRFNYRDSTERSTNKLIGNVSSSILGIINQEKGSFVGGLILDVISSFLSEKDLLAPLTREFGKLIRLKVSARPSWTIVFPLARPGGGAEHMLTAVFNDAQMEDAFIEKAVRLLSERFPETGIFFSDTNFHSVDFGSFPYGEKVRFLFDMVFAQQGTLRRRLELKGRTYLASAVKPREMPEKFLLALRTNDSVMALRRRFLAFLGALCLGCVGISLFLGRMLADRFLQPIRGLFSGVEAIRKRDFHFRLPVLDGDEFGDLMRTFNHVTEGLADLEVARIVQERLLPAIPVESGEFRLFGACRPATQLGGDYFDIRRLSDGRIMILVGDVSGHGVPAALVMAMSKALVVERERLATEGGQSLTPSSVLEFLQENIFESIPLKRMMTCFVGILDPVSGVLECANAGHNSPFLFIPGSPPAEIESPPSMPLASRRRKGFGTMILPIPKGTVICFYTDGLVEAKGLSGEMLGYQHSLTAVGGLLGNDPRETYDRITGWHKDVVAPGEQEDDITVLLLQRNP